MRRRSGRTRPRRSRRRACARSGRTTQRRRTARPSVVGGTMSVLWVRPSSSRIAPQAGPMLPLLQGFPEHVGEEADEDVCLHAVLAPMPDRPDGQLALLDAEGGFGLDVGAPQVPGTPVRDVGAEHVAAFAVARPVIPLGARAPGQTQARGDTGVGNDLDEVAAGRAGVAGPAGGRVGARSARAPRAGGRGRAGGSAW